MKHLYVVLKTHFKLFSMTVFSYIWNIKKNNMVKVAFLYQGLMWLPVEYGHFVDEEGKFSRG